MDYIRARQNQVTTRAGGYVHAAAQSPGSGAGDVNYRAALEEHFSRRGDNHCATLCRPGSAYGAYYYIGHRRVTNQPHRAGISAAGRRAGVDAEAGAIAQVDAGSADDENVTALVDAGCVGGAAEIHGV